MSIPDVNRSRDWTLTVKVYWRLKDGLDATVPCDYCRGKGKIGGGFGDPDDPRDCPKCFSGRVANPAIEPKPALPVIFTKYVHQTAREYIKRMDAKRFVNEGKLIEESPETVDE